MRPKLPVKERRSYPVYVLLRPREKRLLEKLAAGKSRGAFLREAFLKLYGSALKGKQ